MFRRYTWRNRLMAYVMVALLIGNTCSGAGNIRYVQAENEDGTETEIATDAFDLTVSSAISNTSVTVTYQADVWEESDEYAVYRSVTMFDGADGESEEETVKEEELLTLEVTEDGLFQQATEVFDVKDYADGTYTVWYSLKKETEIIETKSVQFVLDTAATELVTAVSKSQATDEVTYDVTATDRDIEGCDIQLHVQKQTMEGETSYSEKLELENGVQYTQAFTEEGIYCVYVQAKDEAGNESTSEESTFIIDGTQPELKIANMTGENSDIPVSTKNSAIVLQLEMADLTLGKADCEVNVKCNNVTEKATVTWTGTEYKKTAELTFDESAKDGTYIVSLAVQDQLGNAAKKEISFVVDNTPPGIENAVVSYGKGVEEQPEQVKEDTGTVYYLKGDATVSFQVSETNRANTKVVVETIRDGEQREEPKTELFLEEDAEQTFSYVYTKEGRYCTSIYATDEADNTTTPPEQLHFVVDKTAPQVMISGVPDGFMTKEAVTLAFQAEDRNHDYDSYQICISRSDAEGELEYVQITGNGTSSYDVETAIWDALEDDETGIISAKRTLQFAEEGNYRITFSGVDRAGNRATQKELCFTIDHTAPVISGVTYADSNGVIGEKYHNIYSSKAIVVEFDVKDMITAVKEGDVYVTVGTAAEKTDDCPVYIAHKTLGNRYYVQIPTDLQVSEFEDVITIWAKDAIGNEGNCLSGKMIYNTSKPVIRMSSDADYSVWTKQNITFDTTVSDEKSGIKEIVYKVNGKTVKEVRFDKIVYSYDYTVTASENASKVTGYAVSVEVTNNCGVTNSMKKQVYIDKEKPKIVLSGVKNGTHYASNQTISTTVKDVSYTDTKTTYYITRTLDGKKTSIPSTFSPKQYEDSCTRKFVKEGSYEVYAVVTDGAGNRTKSNTLRFVIDKTKPVVNVTGVSEGSMNQGTVTLDFSCEESFFQTNKVSVQVERTLDGNTETKQLQDFPKNKKKTTMQHTFSEDGTYKVTIEAVDKAGNKAQSKTITFSVDQTKPVIYISGTDNYQQWDEPVTVRFMVEESFYSGNRVQINGFKTDIDGNVEKLELPEFVNAGRVSSLVQSFTEDGIYDFEMTAKDEAGNMETQEIHFTVDQTSPYIYKVADFAGGYYQSFQLADSIEELFEDLTIISLKMLLNGVEYNGTDRVEEEGKYNLSVEVWDELGHKSSEQIEFVIDHTAPKVIFQGVKDGERVKEGGNVTLALVNEEDFITAVRMNGKEYGADTRTLQYSEYGSYEIEVDCEDLAGNRVTRSISFVYSNPVMKLVLIGGSIGVLLLMCVAGFIYARKRKEDKES